MSRSLRPRVWLRVLAALLAATPIAHARAADSLDEGRLSQWADAAFSADLVAHRFSGLSLAVVADGRVALARGYGFADYGARKPMDPDHTKLHIASVTKTFMATAIAQLVDRGVIRSLDDPANRYLKRLQLPPAQGRAVSIWDLLTHRAGFEDHLVRTGTLETDPTIPTSAAEVASLLPQFVRPPGTFSVYSNFGVGLLGVIVEDTTGVDLAQYMRENIFEPLGMHDTQLRYSAAPAESLGQPYAFFPDGQAQKITHLGLRPYFAAGGGIVTTASDMAKFMIAQLDAGRGDSARVLSPRMFELMHTRHVGNHRSTAGLGMLFVVSKWGEETVLSHGGGWPGWYSTMILLPQRRVGYFATVMADAPLPTTWEALSRTGRMREGAIRVGRAYGIDDLSSAFTREFLGARWHIDRFAVAPDLQARVGTYWRERRAFSLADILFDLADPQANVMRVTAGGADSLVINGRGPYRALSADTFGLSTNKPPPGPAAAGIDLASVVAFARGPNGRAVLLPPDGESAFTRVGILDNPIVLFRMLVVCMVVAVSGLLVLRWKVDTAFERAGKYAAVGLALAAVAAGYVIYGGFAEGDGWRLYKLAGRVPRFIALGVLGNLGAVLSAVILVLAPVAWRGSPWGEGRYGRMRRGHFSLLGLAALGLIWVLWFANLIGWRLPV